MGTTIKRRDFPAVIKQARQGVFVLAPNVTVPIAAPVLNIGLLLGERMYKAKADSSSVSIVNELDAILGEEYRDITLENTDILFSPEYGLDVIKLLLQLGRNQNFIFTKSMFRPIRAPLFFFLGKRERLRVLRGNSA